MKRELPSEVFKRGLEKYSPSPIAGFVGGNMFVEFQDKFCVTPIGALAAGLGWRHGQNARQAGMEVSDFLDSWQPSLSFDFLAEFLDKAKWNGCKYPFADVERWLIELEEIAGYRDTTEE